MNDDPDIYGAAKLIIDQHGKEASAFAEKRSLTLLDENDIDGAMIWRRILVAIDELQRGRRQDEALN